MHCLNIGAIYNVTFTTLSKVYICCLSGATKPEEINPGLICPVFDELLPCLPKKLRKRLHFGVRHEDVSCEILIKDITPLGVLVVFIISIVSLIPYVIRNFTLLFNKELNFNRHVALPGVNINKYTIIVLQELDLHFQLSDERVNK
jgi:hypothetical protein